MYLCGIRIKKLIIIFEMSEKNNIFIGEIDRVHDRLKGEVPTLSHLLFWYIINIGTMKEIWRDIPGYEGYYKASNLGVIKSQDRHVSHCRSKSGSCFLKGKIKKYESDKNGYYKINLSKEGSTVKFFVHRLIASAFIINPEKKFYINHRNGIKTDNRVENLDWCTHSENDLHAYKTGLRKAPYSSLGKFGKDHPRSKAVLQFDKKGDFIKRYESCTNASEDTDVSISMISSVCSGSRHSKKFIWKYE